MGSEKSQPQGWHQWRRFRTVELLQRGWSQRDIAEALGVSEVTVCRWLARARDDGPSTLLDRVRSGRPSRLSPGQIRMIPEFLSHGTEPYGFRGEVWTCSRVAAVIREEFGVVYHRSHVARLLKMLGWTPQAPIRRACQRDEVAVRRWREVVWPRSLARARRERRRLVFVDESGFHLLPGVVRTYAPAGRTPVLRERLSRDHLSVMGGMTPDGGIYTLVRQEPLNGLHCIEFLVHLGHVAGRRLLVIWDGSPIHRRAEVLEFVSGTRGAVAIEALPGDAPDLNPWDEGGWHYLKDVELRNVACKDLEELHMEFHLALARLRRKPGLIRSFYAQAGLTTGES